MIKFRRNIRKLAVITMIAAMTLSVTACSSHMFDVKDLTGMVKDDVDSYSTVQQEFEDFLHDEYVDSVTSDTLSYNYEI